MNTINYAPLIAGVQIVIGLAGWITGLITPVEATTLVGLGLSTFGLHKTITLGRS